MASRTQLRLGQLTGSFGTAFGKINDQLAAVATGSIAAIDLSGSLSHLASAIKRLHGADSSTTNVAGTFYQSLLPSADDTFDLGSASAAWQDLFLEGDITLTDAGKIVTSAGDLTVEAEANNAKVVIKGDHESGTAIHLDGNAAAASIVDIDAGVLDIDAASIDITATAKLSISGSANLGDAIEINATAGGIHITAAGAAGEDIDILNSNGSINITAAENHADAIVLNASGGTTAEIKLQSEGTTIVKVKNDLVQVDKTLRLQGDNIALQLGASQDFIINHDATNTTLKNITGHLILSGADAKSIKTQLGSNTNTSKFAVHSAADLELFSVDGSGTSTFAADVIIAGGMIVNGATTLLTSSNTVISDGIIGLGVSGSEGYMPATLDRGIIFGGGDLHAKQPALYYDGSAGHFVLATQTVSPSSSSFPSAPAQADLAEIKVAKITFDTNGSEHILSNGTNMTIAAGAGDIVLDAADDIEINAGGDLITFKKAGDLAATFDMSSAGDLIVKDAGGAEIFRLDGSADAILMAANKKIEFRDANSFIHSNDANDLLLGATDVTLDASTDLILDGGASIKIKDDGTQYALLSGSTSGETAGLYISASAGGIHIDGSQDGSVFFDHAGTSYIMASRDPDGSALFAAVNDTDLVFVHDNLDTPVEIMRIDESAEALVFPRQNAGGNAANTGLLAFDGTNGVQEAIYGDGSYLYLRSNNVNFRLPNAVGADGQALVADGTGGNLKFDTVGVPTRSIFNVTASLAKNTEVFLTGSTGNNKTLDILNGSTDVSFHATDTFAARGARTEIYVNGQLLTSGSAAEITAGTMDYRCVTTSTVKFGFALEVEDIIQVVSY